MLQKHRAVGRKCRGSGWLSGPEWLMVSKIRNVPVHTKSHSVPKVQQRWTILLQIKWTLTQFIPQVQKHPVPCQHAAINNPRVKNVKRNETGSLKGMICTQIAELKSLYISNIDQESLTANLMKEVMTVVSSRGLRLSIEQELPEHNLICLKKSRFLHTILTVYD